MEKFWVAYQTVTNTFDEAYLMETQANDKEVLPSPTEISTNFPNIITKFWPK